MDTFLDLGSFQAIQKRVCSMSSDQIRELGVLLLAIHVHDIHCLPLNNSDVVASLGSLDGWEEKQVCIASLVNVLNNILKFFHEMMTDFCVQL